MQQPKGTIDNPSKSNARDFLVMDYFELRREFNSSVHLHGSDYEASCRVFPPTSQVSRAHSSAHQSPTAHYHRNLALG